MMTTSYRDIIEEAYSERKKRNPSYSLRAFSRDCGLSPSHLNDLLSQRYGISATKASQIAERLEFSDNLRERFVLLVESEHSRSKIGREKAKARLIKYLMKPDKNLTEEFFKVVSNWYHFAILELVKTEGFQSSPEWVAKSLNIPVDDADLALKRLLRLNLLRKVNGNYEPTNEFVAAPEGISSQAIRTYHRQHLKKAIAALDEQSTDERDLSAVNFAFDESKLPQLKQEICDFRRKVMKDYEAPSGAQSVYTLNIQVFRLNKQMPATTEV